MKNKLFVIFAVSLFSLLLTATSANDGLLVYKEVNKKPDDNEMDGHGNEGQGVASDRENCWFYSNNKEVYQYDRQFDDYKRITTRDKVYLGCKNGTFKITENGLQKVNGKKNYLREGYLFDGIFYQVFSGILHKSLIVDGKTEEDGWF